MNDDDHETHDEYEARKAEHEKTVMSEYHNEGYDEYLAGDIEPQEFADLVCPRCEEFTDELTAEGMCRHCSAMLDMPDPRDYEEWRG